MNNDEKIREWLEGNLSDENMKEFESAEEQEKLKRLFKAIDNFKAPEYDAGEEFQKLSDTIFQRKNTIPLYKKFNPILRIAAVFVFALLMSYVIYEQLNSTKSISEWTAEHRELYLPDSSFVSLNADSKLKISNSDWEKQRTLELAGEAFFDVKKGSQFKVKTAQGTVTVLGTQFTVKDRSNYYEVACYSGAVQVITPQHSVKLEPGSVFRIMNKKVENYTDSNNTEPAWLNGESKFKSVPLRFVIEELERQHKVRVEAKNIDLNQLFSGSFSNKNLTVALESITFPVNLGYRINGDKIVLSVEGN